MNREIVLSRVYAAPRELVFRAWTERDRLAEWFAPDAFKVEIHEHNATVGGRWRFDYVTASGERMGNRVVYLQIDPPKLLVYEHGSDIDNDPRRFLMTITFEAQSDGKTVVTMRQLHPTVTQRDAGVGFGAVEMGYQTLAKLDAVLRKMLAE